MDLNLPRRQCRKGFFSLKLTSLFRSNEERSRLSILTVKFFLAVPIRFPVSRILPTPTRCDEFIDMANPSNEEGAGVTRNKGLFDSYLLERAQIAENRLYCAFQRFLEAFSAQQFVSQTKLLVAEHPLILFCITALGIAAAFPLLSIIFIAAVSMIATVIGFVLFQGTLLTIATMFAGGFLVMAACFAFPLTVVLGITYLGTSFVVQGFSSAFKQYKKVASRRQEGSVPVANSPRSMVPACVLQSDILLSKRLAGIGRAGFFKENRIITNARESMAVNGSTL